MSARRSRHLTPALATAFLAVVGACLVSCASPSRGVSETEVVTQPFEGVSEELLATFEALRDAVRAEDDDVARRILARIYAAQPTGHSLALADKFRKVLDGRALTASVALSVVGLLDGRGGMTLYLEAKSLIDEELTLQPGPASLRFARTAVDPLGREEHQGSTVAVGQLVIDPIPPRGRSRVELASFPLGDVARLAAKDRWDLTLRSGQILRDGEAYPAQRLPVRPFELDRLAPFLPTSPVEPATFAEYAARERLSMPQLMERAVRIAPERREEALDLVRPVVLAMTEHELSALVPALRWLTGDEAIGGDPLLWREVLESRAYKTSASGEGSVLDLPRSER